MFDIFTFNRCVQHMYYMLYSAVYFACDFSLFVCYVPNVACYVPNVAEYMTSVYILTTDQLTTDLASLKKISNGHISATGHPIHFSVCSSI